MKIELKIVEKWTFKLLLDFRQAQTRIKIRSTFEMYKHAIVTNFIDKNLKLKFGLQISDLKILNLLISFKVLI